MTNRLIIILFLFFSITLIFDYEYKVDKHTSEKIYDLTLQYDYVIKSNKNLTDLFIKKILEDEEVTNILNNANKGIEKAENRKKLFDKYKEHYNYIKSKGISQLHFHLKSGESFLRFHKPEKFGDNLFKIRPTIKAVYDKKSTVIAYEIGEVYDGFRYVYPIKLGKDIIATVECSISPKMVMQTMDSILDARYGIALKKNIVEHKIDKSNIKKHFHTCRLNDEYIMRNNIHNKSTIPMGFSKQFKQKFKTLSKTNSPFTILRNDELAKTRLFIFNPIFNLNNEKIGYLISNRYDTEITSILYEEVIKFILLIITTLVFYYFNNKLKRSNNMLKQYKDAVDKYTLVSRTNTKGIITYVNDSFMKISGYTKDELIGKNHNIVRSENMPKDIFLEMWKTIQSGETWRGKVTNKSKNGSLYTVDATIIPILDDQNEIEDYISIRHDITELEELRSILEKQLDSSVKDLDEKMSLLQQYEEAINNDAILVRTDTKGIVTFINDTYTHISGYTKDEAIGKNFRLLRSPDIATEFYATLWNTITSKKIWRGIIKNINKSGKPFYLSSTIVPILCHDGSIREYMAIHHDVTSLYDLQDEIINTQKEIIYTMGAIGETRSKETGNHVKRVAEYSKILATHYGMNEDEAEMLKMASPMHDIGKVGIPDSILNKPGKLDADEWEVMMTHADIGYQMLKHSDRPILKAAAIVAREHHEKWDGTGYPKKLKGEEIHIYGRITAIADVFDALGSDRVYKKAWELDDILNLLKEQSGKHFDPELISIFFENLDSFLEIRDKCKDELTE